jgi:Tol biopolymer transport system component
VVPLATLPGHEIQPAFSPDGNQVAFVLKTTEIQNSGIYTTMVGGERSLQLTKNPGDYFPAWSPDGRQVAFYRFSGDGMAIYTVPALGGTEQRLYVGRSSAWTDGLSWSPDGKVLAFSETVGNGNRTAIALISLADSTTRQITAPPSGQEIDISPAFSPDGSSVAFVRSILAGVVSDLYVVPSTGGAPKRLTFDQTWIKGSPSWTPDGQDIVFASARGGATGLWRISSSGGVPRAVEGVGATAFNPSIAPKGNQLVYQQFFARESIRRINLKDETHRQGPPTVLSLEKGRNWRPDFSPDGKRFAFESTSSGHAEIWACDSDGAHCGRLTSLHGTAGAPRWSPDGHYIAFEFRPKDRTEIYLLEASGGRPRLLPTLPGADNGGPRWSRDGKWIYFYSDFYSDRGGEPFQLWKVPVEGGAPVRITSNGGLAAAESSDGRFLYFCKFEALGIWKMPLQGGEEERILDQGGGDEWYNWALAQKGIYFLKHYEGEYVLTFFDFAAGKTTPVSSSERIWLGLTLSADDRSLLYSENELEDSTIMLVKNFH